jgi:hypothetical protein
LQEDIEVIAAIGTTTVVVLLFGIQTVPFFAIQAHPVFVIRALLLRVTQAVLLWAIPAAKVKVMLVSSQVMRTPPIMGTLEVQVFNDNEIQWFVSWTVILVRGTGKYIAKDDYTNVL